MSDLPKTWFFTRSTDYAPDNRRLALGQVLTERRVPGTHLFARSSPPDMDGAQVKSVRETDVEIDENSQLALGFGLWANSTVLPAEAALKASAQQNYSWHWELDTLESKLTGFDTVHLAEVLKKEEVKSYVHAKRMRFRFFPRLYIVTGQRIAMGAKMVKRENNAQAAGGGFRVNLDPNQLGAANLGSAINVERIYLNHTSFNKAQDFIFAYELSEISYDLFNVISKPIITADSQSAESAMTKAPDQPLVLKANAPIPRSSEEESTGKEEKYEYEELTRPAARNIGHLLFGSTESTILVTLPLAITVVSLLYWRLFRR